MNSELPAQCEIDLRGAESVEGVASEIALDRAAWYAECSRVDALAPGNVRIGDPLRHAANEVRTLHALISR